MIILLFLFFLFYNLQILRRCCKEGMEQLYIQCAKHVGMKSISVCIQWNCSKLFLLRAKETHQSKKYPPFYSLTLWFFPSKPSSTLSFNPHPVFSLLPFLPFFCFHPKFCILNKTVQTDLCLDFGFFDHLFFPPVLGQMWWKPVTFNMFGHMRI